jgi:hypothetical protein
MARPKMKFGPAVAVELISDLRSKLDDYEFCKGILVKNPASPNFASYEAKAALMPLYELVEKSHPWLPNFEPFPEEGCERLRKWLEAYVTPKGWQRLLAAKRQRKASQKKQNGSYDNRETTVALHVFPSHELGELAKTLGIDKKELLSRLPSWFKRDEAGRVDLSAATCCALIKDKMTTKDKKSGAGTRRGPLLVQREDRALLGALVAQATRRGETLAGLAKILGVSYERLAQWRRGDADIGHAKTSVHEKAGQYLGLPTVLILVLAGVVNLEQFVWPAKDGLPQRLAQELERLRQHPFLGPFVPPGLSLAEPAVQLFVAFLFHELSGESQGAQPSYRWLNALHQATVGNAQATAAPGLQPSRPSSDNALF